VSDVYEKLISYADHANDCTACRTAGKVVRAVLAEHPPGEVRCIDSLNCPRHDPRLLTDNPSKLIREHSQEWDDCPDCVITMEPTCSGRSCHAHGYPCRTVVAVARALGLAEHGIEIKP